jgi:PadR family transcriptional regulator PadR
MAKKNAADKRYPNALDPDGRRSQWLKGVLELCLLGVLEQGEAYGYEISQQLEAAGLGAVKGGTLYPRLTALESAGLVDVEWRAGDGGPGRKYYRLTAIGRSTLLEAAVEYERFSAVTRMLIRGEHKPSQAVAEAEIAPSKRRS